MATLIWQYWICGLCGQPVTNSMVAKYEHCPSCKGLGMWATRRGYAPASVLVVGDERPENKH